MYLINKKVGETPLEALENLRTGKGIADGIPMTYAGRLDPLAEGLLIILVGEECKDKERYLGLDKVYETEIILGLQTDTYDIMGLPKRARMLENLDQKLVSYVGKQNQTYPPFSSKTVNGRPLHEYAKEDSIDSVELPSRKIEIFSLEKISEREIESGELLREIKTRVALVNGDFRQEKILYKWNELLVDKKEKFKIVSLHAHVSSGTYIRGLANSIGGVALSIKRTSIGDFRLS